MLPTRRDTWKFQLREVHADGVFLVRYSRDGASCWTPMTQTAPGVWELELADTATPYRFGYYPRQGRTFLNGGSFGLTATRRSQPEPLPDLGATIRPVTPAAASPVTPAP